MNSPALLLPVRTTLRNHLGTSSLRANSGAHNPAWEPLLHTTLPMALSAHLNTAEGVAASTLLPSGDQARWVTPPPPNHCSWTQFSVDTSHTWRDTEKRGEIRGEKEYTGWWGKSWKLERIQALLLGSAVSLVGFFLQGESVTNTGHAYGIRLCCGSGREPFPSG